MSARVLILNSDESATQSASILYCCVQCSELLYFLTFHFFNNKIITLSEAACPLVLPIVRF